ncbi:DUF2080 family transposase-associated protein [Patescibacteria group bacterium]|nr:DUF2080 family transposase-associated protein [Patescibacteria group bacterium]
MGKNFQALGISGRVYVPKEWAGKKVKVF